MRERLALAFVVTTLLLAIGAGSARAYTLQSQLRDHEGDYLRWEATTIATELSARAGADGAVDAEALRALAPPGVGLTYRAAGGGPVWAAGSGYDASGRGVEASAAVGDGAGVLTLTRPGDDRLKAFGSDDWGSLALLLLGLVLLSGAVGYAVAVALSAPFRRLAQAAAALGRGRFDLDLPTTRIPEARAISQALESSAAQLRERLGRERALGLHTSHELRTPLTSLALHLEELIGDPALSTPAREAARGCLKAVGQLNQVAGELVDLSGRGVLVADAALPLRDVATAVAQRWVDLLDEDGRGLVASVEGDLELLFTPGPVEQVLDLFLRDVVQPDRGDVRLVFEGAASSLRIDIACHDHGVARRPSTDVGAEIEATLLALGGRVEVPADDSPLRVHLPRR